MNKPDEPRGQPDSKSNVIDFGDFKADAQVYETQLQDAHEWLKNVAQELLTRSVNLAVQSKWKKWDNSMPEGSRFPFSPQALFESGDENVVSMMRIWEEIQEAVPDTE